MEKNNDVVEQDTGLIFSVKIPPSKEWRTLKIVLVEETDTVTFDVLGEDLTLNRGDYAKRNELQEKLYDEVDIQVLETGYDPLYEPFTGDTDFDKSSGADINEADIHSTTADPVSNDVLNQSLLEEKLSSEVIDALLADGKFFFGDIAILTKAEFHQIPSLSISARNEIEGVLRSNGLSVGMNLQHWQRLKLSQ